MKSKLTRLIRFFAFQVIMLLFALHVSGQSINGIEGTPTCPNCYNTTVIPSRVSSTLGISTVANDSAAFASGKGSIASGLYSTAFGYYSRALKHSSFAAGYRAKADSAYSVGLGYYSEAVNHYTFSFGKYVRASALNSMVIGKGYDNNPVEYLINAIPNSIMLGMGSTNPTVTILGASTGSGYGKVGIAKSTPTTELDVQGTTTTSNLIISSSAGTGRILQSTNSSGNATWVDPATVTYWSLIDNKLLTDKIVSITNGNHSPVYGSFQIGSEFTFWGSGSNESKIISSNYKWDNYSKRINSGTASSIIFDAATGNIKFNSAGTGAANSEIIWETMYFTPQGRLGIGVTSPTEKLEVTGFTKTSSGYKVGSNTVINSNREYIGSNGTFSGTLNVSGSGNSVFSGNLGIGITPTSEYKLAVAGKIHCTEVVVEGLPWPDYVFEKGYQLMPVKELEVYIRTNKHLPNIPDAKTISDKGLSVGEMNAQLLKKVEELTLYIIEQQNVLENQQKEIEKIKALLTR